MRVYYYHHFNTDNYHKQWQRGELPSHLLYGACHLKEHGIDVVKYHHAHFLRHRLLLSIDTMIQLLANYRRYDAVYATQFRGLELIIFLRALGLYRKPIICWHHLPIVKAHCAVRERIARLFYKGFDELIFFSKKIVDESLKSVKAPRGHMHIVHWGAELDYYDKLKASAESGDEKTNENGFISTGKELRDMPTLIAAFNKTTQPLDIYICREANGFSYANLLDGLKKNENVHVHYISGNVLRSLAVKVNKSKCAVICCKESNYTVGLTTVVEAIALGIPMICSRNPQMPIDIEREGCGLTPDYYDIDGWVKAINFIADNPEKAKEMGRRGHQLAKSAFNDKECAAEVAEIIKHALGKE